MVAVVQISGSCDPRFEAVRDAFTANFLELGDIGASVAVTLAGEPVVDLWGGVCTTDAGPDQEWEADTIINVWSCTKTMTFLVILMLADRGLLDIDAPVADVWPEFGAAGKQAVTTAHVMSHASGLAGLDQPVNPTDLYDWDLMCGRLAAQAPWWEPGTQSGYHAITQGFLLGEIVRRVTGRTLGEFFATEVAEPLGADFHIGTPAEHDRRVAHVIPPPAIGGGVIPPDTISYRTFTSVPLVAAQSSTIDWRRAEIGAAGGHGNARSIARVMAVLANEGELDGCRYLSAAVCNRIFEEQQNGLDLVLLSPLRFGLGFGLGQPERPLDNDRCCYWNGWGGSRAFVDMQHAVSVSYAMNEMRHNLTGDERSEALVRAVYDSLPA
jgi:CubicO group peptidase (beta-lactamase class C family)